MNFYDLLIRDEGKKGQKRGQHIMASDPEYLKNIKGGNFGSAKRATYMGALKGQEKRLSKEYEKHIIEGMKTGDWDRFRKIENKPKYNQITALNKLFMNQKTKKRLRSEAKAASEASKSVGHNILSAKTRMGSGIKVNVPKDVKVKKFLPRWAKYGIAGATVAGGLSGGYLAHKLRGKDNAYDVRKKRDLNVPGKANVAIAAALLSAPLAILLDKFVLIPIMHHFDIQDIYDGKWREKDFVSYIKAQYRRRSDKFWLDILEPGIEPRSFSESDYQKTKQLVMNAQSAKDLSRVFPNNKFLRKASEAFDLINSKKRSDSMYSRRHRDSAIIRKINFLKARRHSDALKIRQLKRHLDLSGGAKLALAIGGGIVGGGTLGVLLGKYVINPLANKMNINMIYNGDYPEELFLNTFKTYFKSGTSGLRRFVEPEVWDEISTNNFESFRSKVMAARKVSDLVRLFPNSKFLSDVNAAYKQAKASGVY